MKIINGEAARKRMAHHLTECEETGEALCIVTQKPGREPQQMIVMSKVKYDELMEATATTRDIYGNPPGYKSTFMIDAIDASTKRVTADIKVKESK